MSKTFRIMFLDDAEFRCRTFTGVAKQVCEEKGITLHLDVAKSAQEAEAFLLNGDRYDLAAYDHDLCTEHYMAQQIENVGGEEFDYGSTPTGFDVARTTVAMDADKLPHVGVVHSMNDAGRKKIHDCLVDGGIPTVVMFPYDPRTYVMVLNQVVDQLILPRSA